MTTLNIAMVIKSFKNQDLVKHVVGVNMVCSEIKPVVNMTPVKNTEDIFVFDPMEMTMTFNVFNFKKLAQDGENNLLFTYAKLYAIEAYRMARSFTMLRETFGINIALDIFEYAYLAFKYEAIKYAQFIIPYRDHDKFDYVSEEQAEKGLLKDLTREVKTYDVIKQHVIK